MSEGNRNCLSARGRIHLRHENRRIDRAKRSPSADDPGSGQTNDQTGQGNGRSAQERWQSMESVGSSSMSTVCCEKGAPLYAYAKASTDSIDAIAPVSAPVRQRKSRWRSLCVQGNSILGLAVSIDLQDHLWIRQNAFWPLAVC